MLLASILALSMVPAAGTGFQSVTEVADEAAALAREKKRLDRADGALARLLRKRAEDIDPFLDAARLDRIAALARGWRAYAELECSMVGQMTGGSPRWRDIYALTCEQRRYGARTALVREVTACVEAALKDAEGKSAAEACLQRLTPLRGEGDYSA